MKKLSSRYIVGKHKLADGRRVDVVIMTEWPFLVVGQRTFMRDKRQSEMARLEWVEHSTDYHMQGKARGYRVYTHPFCALEELDEREVPDWKDFLFRSLCEMADFYAAQMTDAQRAHYRDLPGQAEKFPELEELR